MQKNGKALEGQRYPIPPQIFNGEHYLGVSEFPMTMTDFLI